MSAIQTLSAWVNTTMTAMGARLFRNSTGMAWQGKSENVRVAGRPAVLIKDPVFLPFGLIVKTDTRTKSKKKSTGGGADKIGWIPERIPASYSQAQIWAAYLSGRDSIGNPDTPGEVFQEFLDRPGMEPDFPARTVALFLAVEEKTITDRLDADQRNFLDQVDQAGGMAFVAKETADGPKLIRWKKD